MAENITGPIIDPNGIIAGAICTDIILGDDAAADPWTPAEIDAADMLFWADADDATTITAAGGNVSQWNDKSGNDNHVSTATASIQPLTGTQTLDGKNVIDFIDDRLEFSSSIAIRAAFVVVDDLDGSSASANIAPLFGEISDADLYTFVRTNATGEDISLDGTQTTQHTASFNAGTENTARNPSLGLSIAQKAGPGLWTCLFSTPQTTGGIATFISSSTTYNLDGRIAEMVFLTAVPTTDIKERLQGYLAHKWGLEGELPPGFTYKAAPPTI